MKKILLFMVMVVGLFAAAIAQTKPITGKVVDKEGKPVSGASVIIKGTSLGVASDDEGSFTISAKTGDILVVSAVNYGSKQIKVGNQTSVKVSLETTEAIMSEVVVTGTGSATSKRRIAISVETISSDKLPNTPGASIDQALVGKVAGAQISTNSGNPGSPVSIQLRGINTIGAGTQPMVLIDGVEMGVSSLNTLDLNTIDRVEVVQGAASATIYGAQGANGVIQIFTKKGKAGKSKIDFSSRVSWDKMINNGDVHQPFNHSFKTNASGDIVTSTNALVDVDAAGVWTNGIWDKSPTALNNTPYKNKTKYYDHLKQLFREARTTNNNLYISGGKDKSDYAIGLSQQKQESVIDGDLTRTNLTLNYGFELFKDLKVRSITQVVSTNNTTGAGGLDPDFANTSLNNVSDNISRAFYTYPFADFTFKDADGNAPIYFGDFAGANSRNPYYYRQYRHYTDKQLDLIPTLNLNYKFPKFLELDYKYGINHNREDYTRTDGNQTTNANSIETGKFIGDKDNTGEIKNILYNTTSQNSLATAILKFDFDKDFGLSKLPLNSTTTATYDWRERKSGFTDLIYYGMPLYAANANQASSKTVSNVYEDVFRTFGYFVNEKLEWADIAGISGGFRSDLSSTFGSGQKPQTFPRGDAYVRLSKFSFWDGIAGIVPELKLRAAYGEAGIQPGVFDRIQTLNNGVTTNGAYFSNPSTLANQDLTVERSKETEVGADLEIKPGKKNWFSTISFSGTYWSRKGSNIIWVKPLPISSGAASLNSNIMDLSSNGLQFSIDANVYESKNLSWNFVTVFGSSKTMVDKISGTPDIPLTWANSATYTLKTGEQVGSVYGQKALTSIDQKDQSGNYYLDQTAKADYQVVNGKVVELASKSIQVTTDKYALGNTTPKFNMSFTNTFNYKGYLSLSFQLDWISGAKQYNSTKQWLYSEGLHGDFDKSVSIGGQNGPWTAYWNSFYNGNNTLDYFLEDASFLRLRNISLSFDVAKFTKIPFTNKLQLFVSGRNIWTSTKYTGMDPEANQNTSTTGSTGNSQTSVQRGLDYFSFPNTKSYQVGINIGL